MKRAVILLAVIIFALNVKGQTKYSLHKMNIEFNSKKTYSSVNHARLNRIYPKQLSAKISSLDSAIYWGYDTTTNVWEPYSKTLDYSFNANNNLIGDSIQCWFGLQQRNFWQTCAQEAYTFDTNNNLLSYKAYDWNGVSFNISSAQTYTYNTNNDSTDYILQYWENNTLTNRYHANYSYDVNHHLVKKLEQNWDTANHAWVNQDSITYTYTGNNLTYSQYQTLLPASSTAASYKDTNFTYNAKNQLTSYTSIGWDSNSSNWQPFLKEILTYDANNNLTSDVYQSYDIPYWFGTWVSYAQDLYTYDANNNLVEYLTQEWNGSAWVTQVKSIYTYDANNNILSEVDQSYKTNGSTSGLYGTRYYYKNDVTVKNNNNDVNIYPNPSAGMFFIESTNLLNNYTVYDVTGRLVLNQVIQEQPPAFNPFVDVNINSTVIDLSSLSTGIYNINIKSNEGVVNKRVVIVR